MPGPVVAVLNLKGGVGKTTLAAHVFRELFVAKRLSILLVDLDLSLIWVNSFCCLNYMKRW